MEISIPHSEVCGTPRQAASETPSARSLTQDMYSFAQLAPYLVWPAKFCAFVTLETWLHSIATNNLSQVDRLWTILPTIYSVYYALFPLWPRRQLLLLVPYVPEELNFAAADFSPRAVLMLELIVMWMCRYVR
jgi:hypothetical protein